MKKSTKKKIRQAGKTIALELLEAIKAFGDLIPEPFESPGQYRWRNHMAAGGFSAEQIKSSFYYLQNKDLIKKKKVKSGFVYSLTISGQQKLLLSKIGQNKFSPKDGTSCIIAFDVPEEKRKHRRFLRRLLVQNGFINLQKSVMIGPAFLPKEFITLLHELKLRRNVTIIKGKILYS